MGMMEAVRLFFKNYTKFQGRSRRAEYWWVQLFFLLISIAAMIVMGIFAAMGDIGIMIASILYIILLLASLACLIPGLAVSFRRLHDTDRSAWWLLIALIPFGSIVLLVFFCLEGTQGPNKFGADPKGGTAADTFD